MLLLQDWLHGLFVGNGLLGIMVTAETGAPWVAAGQPGMVLRLKIGRTDVYGIYFMMLA